MAILIVDDESSTRTALRDLLTQIGHKTILEAKNGEEALKVIEADKNRIRMIVADWEMPYMDGLTLLERVSVLPEVDLVPFLLITSDLPRAKLAEIQARTDRLDGFLIKPFRMSALEKAMYQAQAHRSASRRTLIAFEGGVPLHALRDAAAANGQTVIAAQNISELQDALKTHGRQLSAIVLGGPSPAPAALTEWLAQFARTPIGTQTPLICASRDPATIFPFRTFCRYFVPVDALAPAWLATLQQAQSAQQSSLECELVFQEIKTALQAKDAGAAQKAAKRILALDAGNSEAHSTLGDLLEAQGKRAQAVEHYHQALLANPCQPRPYIRLLEIAPSSAIATEAARFCPHNQDTLLAAARVWIEKGEILQAAEALRRIIALNPKQSDAAELLAKITQP